MIEGGCATCPICGSPLKATDRGYPNEMIYECRPDCPVRKVTVEFR